MTKLYAWIGLGLFFFFGMPMVATAISQVWKNFGETSLTALGFENKVVYILIAIMGILMVISWQLAEIANKSD